MQANGSHFIATEARPYLLVVLLLIFIAYAWIGILAAIPLVLLLAILAYIFRNPACEIPSVPLAVISPVNGTLINIKSLDNPWLSRPAIRFRIHMSFWDVHTIRSPVEGKIVKQWSSFTEGSNNRRRHTFLIKTDEGDEVIMSLAMSRWAPLVKLNLQTGERIGQGLICGFFYFTGIIDVLIDGDSYVELDTQQQLKAGMSILGKFKHTNGVSFVNG